MKLILTLSILVASAAAFAARAAEPAIIPQPEHMTVHDGVFTLNEKTTVIASGKAEATGKLLAELFQSPTGWTLDAKPSGPSAGAITLTTEGADPSLGEEGYELIVKPDSVLIRAPSDSGLFYGAVTFAQLLPPEVFANHLSADIKWEARCVEIKDKPRFPWRGMLWDVSRHFYTKEEVEKVLDALALHKINVLHWHLVDDQGWRIEIKRYPKLTEVGAWRKDIGTKNWGMDAKSSTAYGPDGRYGGFYTQDDIREVVSYAAVRHITIVPEIEMPGHSGAALASYPEFSCTGAPKFSTDVGSRMGVYCAGNDESFTFLQNVLEEVFALFPGKYIHIGGDEVTTEYWAKCDKCRARKKAEGFTTDSQLQSYFIQRMEKFINAHGRLLIGWSEIREGGLAQNAALMDWIGGATEGASAGHDVVMTVEKDCYLDHYQSKNHATEPRAIGGFLPLRNAYNFEPIPTNLAAQFQSHILGAQGNLWTEYIPNLKHAEYMIFPRESALAEVTWSPKSERNLNDFLRRLEVDNRRLDQMGVNYRRNPTDTGE